MSIYAILLGAGLQYAQVEGAGLQYAPVEGARLQLRAGFTAFSRRCIHTSELICQFCDACTMSEGSLAEKGSFKTL